MVLGEIPDTDGMDKVGNLVDGDLVHIRIKLEYDKSEDVKFHNFRLRGGKAPHREKRSAHTLRPSPMVVS